MDLEELKKKFRDKIRADLKDIDIALKATPFLCREVCRLEDELAGSEKRIKFLTEQLNKRLPPASREGERKGCRWKADVDFKNNLMTIILAGEFDYRTAKIATNQALETLPNLMPECSVIFDVSGISPLSDKKLIFHLRKTMQHIRQIKIRRLAYIPNLSMPGIGFVFEEYSDKDNYRIHKAQSVEEALKAIVNVERFLKV